MTPIESVPASSVTPTALRGRRRSIMAAAAVSPGFPPRNNVRGFGRKRNVRWLAASTRINLYSSLSLASARPLEPLVRRLVERAVARDALGLVLGVRADVVRDQAEALLAQTLDGLGRAFELGLQLPRRRPQPAGQRCAQPLGGGDARSVI